MFSVRTGRRSRSSRVHAGDVRAGSARWSSTTRRRPGTASRRSRPGARTASAARRRRRRGAACPCVQRMPVGRVVAIRCAELDDPLLGEAGDLRPRGRRELEDALLERLPADRVRWRGTRGPRRPCRRSPTSAPARARRRCPAAARGARPPRSAVRVRSGSIETRCAPFFCAARMNLKTWWPLVSGFVPHSRISLESANVSGSIPAAVPVVYDAPEPARRPSTPSSRAATRRARSTARWPARPSRPWT